MSEIPGWQQEINMERLRQNEVFAATFLAPLGLLSGWLVAIGLILLPLIWLLR